MDEVKFSALAQDLVSVAAKLAVVRDGYSEVESLDLYSTRDIVLRTTLSCGKFHYSVSVDHFESRSNDVWVLFDGSSEVSIEEAFARAKDSGESDLVRESPKPAGSNNPAPSLLTYMVDHIGLSQR